MARKYLQSILVQLYFDHSSGINEEDPQTAIAINKACNNIVELVKHSVTSNLPSGVYATFEDS